MKINESEGPQYYVENSHPPIVSKAVFELAQLEIQKRAEMLVNRAAGIASRAGCAANAAAGITAVRFGIQPTSTERRSGSATTHSAMARSARRHTYMRLNCYAFAWMSRIGSGTHVMVPLPNVMAKNANDIVARRIEPNQS